MTETPMSLAESEAAGFRQFCKSVVRSQEILCWAVVESVLDQVEALPRTQTDDQGEVENLCSIVRKCAHDLMRCHDSKEAIASGALTSQTMAAFVRLVQSIPQAQLLRAFHQAHLAAPPEKVAPFASFAKLMLSVCNCVDRESPPRSLDSERGLSVA